MVRRFHTALGILLLLIYVYIVFHQERVLPGLAAADRGLPGALLAPRLSRGLLVVYGLPLAAIVCFILPTRLMWWLSPRPPPEYDYLLREPFWYFIGYVLVGISAAVFALFR